MPHERLKPSFVFDEERIKQLQQITPEAFSDGKINWEVLKQALGEQLEEEGAEAEHFGLFWPGKREARKLASIPSRGALIPVKGEGTNEDKTKNIFIEGENLEVLKLLQKSYVGKIKMIYIDPPYNTGNDFIYNDNFTEPLEEYLKYTGQMDEEGKLLTTNTKADGRFHSRWLSMMYPRLRLARNLLKDDGIIFISIDDNELAHLAKVCDEIFGEENFIGNFVWVKKKKGSHLSKTIRSMTEYILAYAKIKENVQLFGEEAYSDKWQPLAKRTNAHKELKFPAGAVESTLSDGIYRSGMHGEGTSALKFIDNFEVKSGMVKTEIKVSGPFVWSQRMLDEELKCGTKAALSKKFGFNVLRYNQDEKIKRPSTLLDSSLSVGTNEDAYEEMIKIFNLEGVMNYPKPSSLMKYLARAATYWDSNEIIMDFFAGSATTAHAILSLNNEQECAHKFICVQLPEPCECNSSAMKAGYKNIAEIAKERIRIIIKSLKKESKKDAGQDLGFKVFKLDKSNFKQWQDYKGKDPKELTSLFKEHEIPLVDEWKPENLLVEVILQEGFPLDSEITTLREYKKNDVIQIKSEFCEHKLLACFDKKIYQETINTLNIQSEDIFVCLDSALSDEQKITLSDKGFLKTI